MASFLGNKKLVTNNLVINFRVKRETSLFTNVENMFVRRGEDGEISLNGRELVLVSGKYLNINSDILRINYVLGNCVAP